jgi:hypothetical protein
MTSVHYQVEFFSELESRWVPLFGSFKTEREAWEKTADLTNPKRVVKVTHTAEVVRTTLGERQERQRYRVRQDEDN